jgi:Ni/Fe-hydrogenase subunit HybB-like protein
VVTGGLILASAVILYFRFYLGLGAVTNLSQEFPWGIWKAFNVVTGVAFAGGAYVVTFMVYVLRMEKYHPIVRVTVLNGLLAYSFYAGALLLELGRPWNVINPIIGNSFGFSSVLFLVAWHFMLYMLAQFVEFSPAAAEWLKLERLRKTLAAMTLGAVVLGNHALPRCTNRGWVPSSSWPGTRSTPCGTPSTSPSSSSSPASSPGSPW